MENKDNRITVYINKSEDFSKPVLSHLRELIHKACPQAEETIKWGFPHFDYLGEMMCSMAAFKQHCAFGFWKASLMKESEKVLITTGRSSMGHLGKIKNLKDLPSDKILMSCIKEAMKLNESGIKIKKPVSTKSKDIDIPEYFEKAISKNVKAKKIFAEFSPSKKREYIEWVTEAKSEITRDKRLLTSVEWITEGKSKNWKYEKK